MLLLTVFLSLPLFANANNMQNVIYVQVQSCKFSFTVPEGWDTIPHSEIAKKLGKDIAVLGLYPNGQEEYFRNEYVIMSFLPTVECLNNMPFEKIVENLEKMNGQKSNMSQSDTIRIAYHGMSSSTNDNRFQIHTSMTIYKDSVKMNCLQNLLLTKFGYVSVAYYEKKQTCRKYSDVMQKIILGVKIHDDYIYIEPQKESVFTPVKIAMSIGIGVLVYLIMVLFDKKK